MNAGADILILIPSFSKEMKDCGHTRAGKLIKVLVMINESDKYCDINVKGYVWH